MEKKNSEQFGVEENIKKHICNLVNLTLLSYHLAVINSNWYKVITGVLFYGEHFMGVILLSVLGRELVHAHWHIY